MELVVEILAGLAIASLCVTSTHALVRPCDIVHLATNFLTIARALGQNIHFSHVIMILAFQKIKKQMI